VTEDEIIAFVSNLPEVDTLIAGEENGAPAIAWGDSFFYYGTAVDNRTGDDSRTAEPAEHRLPFATIVIKDYPGFDTASNLDRPGVFRLNIAVGRRGFQDLFGHSPAAFPEHRANYDFAALDRIIPHPVYATQGWASIINPGDETGESAKALLVQAHARAALRHRR
jgi:Family of unknown function (DUF6194)